MHLVGSADPRTINEHQRLLKEGMLEDVPITIDAPVEIPNEVPNLSPILTVVLALDS